MVLDRIMLGLSQFSKPHSDVSQNFWLLLYVNTFSIQYIFLYLQYVYCEIYRNPLSNPLHGTRMLFFHENSNLTNPLKLKQIYNFILGLKFLGFFLFPYLKLMRIKSIILFLDTFYGSWWSGGEILTPKSEGSEFGR